MSKFTDAHHLTTHSYNTQHKLQVRILTHQRYTHPTIDFPAWVLDKIPWRGDEQVLDVGCGSGIYMAAARQRSPRYVACDLSMGMLQNLPHPLPSRVNLNIQHLPFATETADVVLANHMLYHVPNKPQAIAEIARILKPGGWLLAATNSETNMAELRHLNQQAMHQLGFPPIPNFRELSHAFSLENGEDLLRGSFTAVTRHDFHSALIFPSPQPVIDYLESSQDWYQEHLPATHWDRFIHATHQLLADHIAQHGEYRVHKLAGVFACQKM